MAMKSTMHVSDAMSYSAITGSKNDKVSDLAQIMRDKKIGAVVIVNEDDVPIGMVTEGDMVRKIVAEHRDPRNTTAADIMTTPVITITEDISLDAAARLMASNRIKKLCIVDLNGKLNGILTEGDIVKHAVGLIGIFEQ
ncbi:CBS domain-containing protein [Candidatus Marsarchaeota archaeon]|nr:CBS domain-containing protein [Candidatus Marsarchaeota archaeon]MCL5404382.1 CBS domain-containing protein [Candidatus Marsarchaeota archaeon]